ncbi:hypothetical protein ACMYYO_00150 [Dermacoccaceae bacterium W4C1]
MRPRVFAGPDAITRAANVLQRKGVVCAMFAYVTDDPIGLADQDILIVNAGHRAVRAGATDPSLLRKLFQAGVVILNDPSLHAKALTKGDRALIGSANLSQRSRTLNELVLVTDDRSIVTAVQNAIDTLVASGQAKHLTDAELTELIPQYGADASTKPGSSRSGHEPNGPRHPPSMRRSGASKILLWKSTDHHYRPPEIVDEEPDHRTAFPDVTGLEFVLNASIKDAVAGEVWIDIRGGWLQPPRLVLRARSSKTTLGHPWVLLGYDASAKSVRIPKWLSRSGYMDDLRHGDDPDVAVTNRADVRRLLDLWAR